MDNAPTFSGNWYATEYDMDEDSTGYITGFSKTVSVPSSPQVVEDSLVVARMDRSVNGLADVLVLAGVMPGAELGAFDSNSSGIPDGPEGLLGIDQPTYLSISNDDTNESRIADWYERSLGLFSTSQDPVPPVLGDVMRSGTVSLSDAIRALQLINGAVPFDHDVVNLNALNVTGAGPNSLTNPLQILRHQAAVRILFPAVSGVN